MSAKPRIIDKFPSIPIHLIKAPGAEQVTCTSFFTLPPNVRKLSIREQIFQETIQEHNHLELHEKSTAKSSVMTKCLVHQNNY
uniref:Uncharacterized protein n=1 Tax=Romanomermis culicivorax TaxID=13658 RepID=A0A915KZM0_ROMCU